MIRRASIYYLVLSVFFLAIPLRAQTSTNTGTFTITSAGGTGSKTYAHGLGTTPKVVFFVTNYIASGTESATSNSESYSFGIGISSTERRALWRGSPVSVDPSVAKNRIRDDRVIMAYRWNSGTSVFDLAYDADLVSYDATNITLNIVAAPGADVVVGFYAIGGNDLTDFNLLTLTQPGSLGNWDTTSLSYQPGFLFLFSTNATALNTESAGSALNIGFTDGTNAALVSVHQEDAAGTSDSNFYERSAASQLEIWARIDATSTAIDQRNSFVSFLSNGFRLNAVETTSSATLIFALTMKGPQFAVGDLTNPTANGNFSETGLAFQPKGLFTAYATSVTSSQSTSDTTAAQDWLAIGTATSTSARWVWGTQSTDNRPSNDLKDHRNSQTSCYARWNPNSTTVQTVGDFFSFNTDGYSLNQTGSTDTTARLITYWVIGDAAVPSRGPRRVFITELGLAGGLGSASDRKTTTTVFLDDVGINRADFTSARPDRPAR